MKEVYTDSIIEYDFDFSLYLQVIKACISTYRILLEDVDFKVYIYDATTKWDI